MADETESEIVVSGNSAKKKLPSPWKVGLLGTLTMGPIGPFMGVAQHFRNKSYLEKQAALESRLNYEHSQARDILDKEMGIADEDEKRLIEVARGYIADGYERLASGDKSGDQLIARAQTLLENVIGGDIQFRKQEQKAQNDMQRELFSNSAKKYRDEHQNTIDAVNGVDHQATKILALVADPNFDPNKPINRAHLSELLSAGTAMFKDTPDLMDGLAQGVGALNGVAGGVVGGIATMIKSNDFKVTPEDYNRLALNAQKYARVFGERKMSQLGDQSLALDAFGKRTGIIPNDYSIRDYVSGGEQELRMAPNPNFTGGYQSKGEPSRTIYRPPQTTTTLTSPTVAKPIEYNTGGYPAVRRPTN